MTNNLPDNGQFPFQTIFKSSAILHSRTAITAITGVGVVSRGQEQLRRKFG